MPIDPKGPAIPTSGSSGSTGSHTPREDAERLRQSAQHEADAARRLASDASQSAKEQAMRLAGQAKERAYQGVGRGKDYAASNIEDFAAAIRRASDELGERDQSMAASLVRQAAGGLESVARSVKGQDAQDMFRAVAGFARRQPALFMLGAALAGVALGRFARASSEHNMSGHDGERDIMQRDQRETETYFSSGTSGSSRSGSRSYQPFEGSAVGAAGMTRSTSSPLGSGALGGAGTASGAASSRATRDPSPSISTSTNPITGDDNGR